MQIVRRNRVFPRLKTRADLVDRNLILEGITLLIEVRRGETVEQMSAKYKELNPGVPASVVNEMFYPALLNAYGWRITEISTALTGIYQGPGSLPFVTAKLRQAIKRHYTTQNERDIVLRLCLDMLE